MSEIYPNLPKSATIPPGGLLEVISTTSLSNGIFAPRGPKLPKPKDNKSNGSNSPGLGFENFKPTGLNLNDNPWDVSFDPNQAFYTVRNLSSTKSTIDSKYRLRHICSILLPNKEEVYISVRFQDQHRSTIKAQIKITMQFEKKFLDNLHDLLLGFSYVISWNG